MAPWHRRFGFHYRPGGGAQGRDATGHTTCGKAVEARHYPSAGRVLSVEPELERRPPVAARSATAVPAGGHASSYKGDSATGLRTPLFTRSPAARSSAAKRRRLARVTSGRPFGSVRTRPRGERSRSVVALLVLTVQP